MDGTYVFFMKLSASALVVLSVALAADTAAEVRQRPWDLTIEQRLAMRLDPAEIRRRFKAAADDGPPGAVASAEVRHSGLVIDGRTHPELFLPWELFDHLVKASDDPAESTSHRQRYDATIAAYGWDPADFWRELDTIDAPYARLRRESLALQRQSSSPGDGLAPLAHELCAARAGALGLARERFGARLEEFLYVEIAPKMSMRSSRVIDGATLVWISGGCR